jgi:hypothetical protein
VHIKKATDASCSELTLNGMITTPTPPSVTVNYNGVLSCNLTGIVVTAGGAQTYRWLSSTGLVL